MPTFQPKRMTQIHRRMMARVVAQTALSDLTDSSTFKQVLAAAAREDSDQYYQMQRQRNIWDLSKAEGEDLDERAKEITDDTLVRAAAVAATGDVVFSRAGTTGTVTINIGTVVKDSDGNEYETTEQAEITPTSAVIIAGHSVGQDSALTPVIARVAGVAGNVAAGSLIKFSSKPVGVNEVTNPSVLTGGQDKETDDDFRERIRAYIRTLPRCTVDALEFYAKTATLVTGEKVQYAKAVEDLIDRGEVTLYIDDGSGSVETSTVIGAEAAASVTAGVAENYTFAGGETLTVKVNQGAVQTVNFTVGTFTAAQVATTITGALTGATAADVGGSVVITTTKTGDEAFIEVTGGTANTTILQFPTTEQVGVGDTLTAGLDPDDEAVGGEVRLYLSNTPVKTAAGNTIVSSTRGTLTEGAAPGGQYILEPAGGQVQFDPALVVGERIVASYTYYTGLMQETQKIINGDPDDRANYPGYKAAGVRVQVTAPQVLQQTVTAVMTIKESFDRPTLVTAAETAVTDYINTLGIGANVVRNEVIERIMAIDGVTDVSLTVPAANVTILDNQLPRITAANLTIS